MFVAGWRPALRSEWPFIIIIVNVRQAKGRLEGRIGSNQLVVLGNDAITYESLLEKTKKLTSIRDPSPSQIPHLVRSNCGPHRHRMWASPTQCSFRRLIALLLGVPPFASFVLWFVYPPFPLPYILYPIPSEPRFQTAVVAPQGYTLGCWLAGGGCGSRPLMSSFFHATKPPCPHATAMCDVRPPRLSGDCYSPTARMLQPCTPPSPVLGLGHVVSGDCYSPTARMLQPCMPPSPVLGHVASGNWRELGAAQHVMVVVQAPDALYGTPAEG